MQEQRKVAVVTGASQGIGRAIASALLELGCQVIAIGRSPEKLATLEEVSRETAGALACEALDVRDSVEFERRLAAWIARWARIDFLVNAAGVLEPGSLLSSPREVIRDVVETNFVATLEVSLAVARQMAAQRHGSIVTIGSNSGTTARLGLGAYPASKAGIIHAMKCLGLELAQYGVRCNVVSPGSTNTEMQSRFQSTSGSSDAVLNGNLSQYRLGIPLKRMADPQDVCDLVLFLLSDRARHITMENVVIDGGATLGAR